MQVNCIQGKYLPVLCYHSGLENKYFRTQWPSGEQEESEEEDISGGLCSYLALLMVLMVCACMHACMGESCGG